MTIQVSITEACGCCSNSEYVRVRVEDGFNREQVLEAIDAQTEFPSSGSYFDGLYLNHLFDGTVGNYHLWSLHVDYYEDIDYTIHY